MLTCVLNSKFFATFTLLPRERKIGWQVRPASLQFLPTLHAPVEKNIWPINGHPIDLPAWFLASAHRQKWIRAGPHDANTGVGKSTLPVICVWLPGPQSWDVHLILLICKKTKQNVCIKRNVWLKSGCREMLWCYLWADMKHPFLSRTHREVRKQKEGDPGLGHCQYTQLVISTNTGVFPMTGMIVRHERDLYAYFTLMSFCFRVTHHVSLYCHTYSPENFVRKLMVMRESERASCGWGCLV